MQKARKKPGKAVKKPKTRDVILDHAFRCFAEGGPSALSVSRVAQSAGIPHTLVLYHFPSMEGMLVELVQKTLQDLKALTVESIEKVAQDPKRALEAYVRAPFAWIEKDPASFALWMHFYARAAAPGEFRKINDSVRKQGRERITVLLYEGIAKKVFPAKLAARVEELSYDIQSIITGYAIQAGTETGESPKNRARGAIDQVFGLLS